LLLSILLPALGSARESARSVRCLSNLKTIGMGIMYYAQDHANVLPGPLHPPVFRLTGTGGSAGGAQFQPMNPNTERPWFLLARIAKYMGGEDEVLRNIDKLATCDTAVLKNPDSKFIPNVSGNPSWSRPFNYTINSDPNTLPSYYFGWTNTGYTWPGWVYENSRDPNRFPPPKKIDWLKRVSDEWAVGDAWWNVKRVMIVPGQFQTFVLGTWRIMKSASNPLDSSGMSHNPLPKAPYHKNGRGTNLVHFDGHGSTFVGIEQWAFVYPANRPPPSP